MKTSSAIALGLTVVLSLSLNVPQADAQTQTKTYKGTSGAAAGAAKQGTYGKGACGATGKYSQSMAKGCAATVTGPEGSTATGGRTTGYKKGEGAARASGYEASTDKGNFSGAKTRVYDAQTGAGSRSTSKSADINKDGTDDYSVDGDTAYQKGEGATTTVDTQNKGSATCTSGTGCDKENP